jgi:Domain of Unknown Function (DUF1206)
VIRTPTTTHVVQIKDEAAVHARSAAREASPWITGLGRLGFACKGAVYLLIGVLAFQAATGRGGTTTDSLGALQHIVDAPFGKALLALIALGLAGYVLWRFVQALLDTDNQGTELAGLVARGGYLLSGVIYTSVALAALRLMQGTGGNGNGDQEAQDWSAQLLAQPFGVVLLVLVGLGVLASAALQFIHAAKADFRKELNTQEMDGRTQEFASRAGRIGHAARGVTFGITGVYLLVAALHQSPEEARGLAGSLAALLEQPYGAFLLGVVAAGLAMYGLYMFVQARYRRMVL